LLDEQGLCAAAPFPPVRSSVLSLESRPNSNGFERRAVGSIHDHLAYWQDTFEHDEYVYNILREGYRIPIDGSLPGAPADPYGNYRKPNNLSAVKYIVFVREEVARLVKAGLIIKNDKPPRCINPLSVAYKRCSNGKVKMRMVTDVSRFGNLLIPKSKYRMTQFKDVLERANVGDFMAVFDTKAAYHHVRLHPDSYELLGFATPEEDGSESYYYFIV
jgi:hypothetical protein